VAIGRINVYLSEWKKMPWPRRGWHGFCAALTAADAKTMPKVLCGMNVTEFGKMYRFGNAGRKSRREGERKSRRL